MQMHEQDFLDTQVRTKQKVTVYTTRGLALIGRIKSFDSDTIILEGKTYQKKDQ